MSDETQNDRRDFGRDSGRDYGRDSGRDYGRDSRSFRGGKKPFFKKKVCRFCTQDIKADYKKPDLLQRFVTDRGKILPRRITGTCAKHQRDLSREIKRARVLAYLPFVKQ
jgi:small subunit ribosomal protein S18